MLLLNEISIISNKVLVKTKYFQEESLSVGDLGTEETNKATKNATGAKSRTADASTWKDTSRFQVQIDTKPKPFETYLAEQFSTPEF